VSSPHLFPMLMFETDYVVVKPSCCYAAAAFPA
jgi:hypothetical protein